MAPELFNNNINNINLFKSDIWSLGITLYFTIVGDLPWFPGDEIALESQIKSCIISFPSSIDIKLIEFVRKLIILNPNERPSAEDLLKLPELQFNEKSLINSKLTSNSKKYNSQHNIIFSKKRNNKISQQLSKEDKLTLNNYFSFI